MDPEVKAGQSIASGPTPGAPVDRLDRGRVVAVAVAASVGGMERLGHHAREVVIDARTREFRADLVTLSSIAKAARTRPHRPARDTEAFKVGGGTEIEIVVDRAHRPDVPFLHLHDPGDRDLDLRYRAQQSDSGADARSERDDDLRRALRCVR